MIDNNHADKYICKYFEQVHTHFAKRDLKIHHWRWEFTWEDPIEVGASFYEKGGDTTYANWPFSH